MIPVIEISKNAPQFVTGYNELNSDIYQAPASYEKKALNSIFTH